MFNCYLDANLCVISCFNSSMIGLYHTEISPLLCKKNPIEWFLYGKEKITKKLRPEIVKILRCKQKQTAI